MTNTTTKDVDLIPTTAGEVAKAIVFLLVALATFLATALTDNDLSELEFLQGCVVLAGVVPVYLVTGRIPKTVAAGAVAGLQMLIVLVSGGTGLWAISISDWLAVGVTIAGAMGVLLIPNAPKPGPLAVVPRQGIEAAMLAQTVLDSQKVAERGKP